MSLDPRREASERQRLALDPEATVWVQASAGTGKTKVLVDRVLALLLAGAAPQRIRCLTFTKAAAAEMKNRLLAALAEWATLPGEALTAGLYALLGRAPAPEEELRAARLFAAVLDAPGGLQVQTIHSFCQSLLARFPLEAGIAPRFALVEERDAGELLRQSLADLYVEAELPGREGELRQALEQLLLAAGDQALTQLAGAVVGRRAWFERCLSLGVVGALAKLQALCGLAPEATRESLLAEALAEPALRLGALRALGALMLEGQKSDVAQAEKMLPLLAADPVARALHYEGYRGAFLTAEGTPRQKLPTKPVKTQDPGAEALFLSEAGRLVALEEKLAALDLLADCRALFTFAQRLLQVYEQRKRAQGALDYADLIAATARLLDRPGQAEWVLYKLDEGIEHLLIDEAQDTSPEQWRVVTQLTGEFHSGAGAFEDREGPRRVRTVFAVGDAKQSIYRFQGADPAGFQAAALHFRARVEAVNRRFRSVPLSHSFRSVEAVLTAVDRVFALPEAAAGVVAREERLEHLATRLGQAGRVELWPLLKPETLEPLRPWSPPVERRDARASTVALAERIAQTLAAWFAADPAGLTPEHPAWLASRGRPVAPGDVLILVRRRGPLFHALARALKAAGVAVAGVDRMVLPQQTAVRDLLALGKFLLLPEDDLSLAEVLTGPLGGLDDADLIRLCAGREGRLWPALLAARAETPAYEAIAALLEGLLARADFVPPYELFAGLLAAGEGRRRWLARLGEEAADPLDEFLTQALLYEREHAPSLQGFLAWLEQGELEVKRDLEAAGQAVRIMTVHGAKGLQAPIVFLPDSTALPRTGESLLFEPEAGLVLRGSGLVGAVPFGERLSQREKAAAAEEYRRLLYVALTRAEDRLYICGHLGAQRLPEDSWYALAAKALAGLDAEAAMALESVQVALEQPQSAEIRSPQAPAPAGPPPPVLGAFARRPPPSEPLPPRPLAPSRLGGEDPPGVSPLAGAAGRWRRGLLIHRLLQSLPELAPDAREAAALRFLSQPAHELDAETVRAWTAETLAVLALPEAAPLFGPASRGEVALAGMVGSQRIAGRLDRLAVTEDAVWLVDYKTNQPPPRAADDVPEQYLRQLAAYGALLARLYEGKEIKSFLLWTDGPRLMQIRTQALRAWLP